MKGSNNQVSRSLIFPTKVFLWKLAPASNVYLYHSITQKKSNKHRPQKMYFDVIFSSSKLGKAFIFHFNLIQFVSQWVGKTRLGWVSDSFDLWAWFIADIECKNFQDVSHFPISIFLNNQDWYFQKGMIFIQTCWREVMSLQVSKRALKQPYFYPTFTWEDTAKGCGFPSFLKIMIFISWKSWFLHIF